MQYMSALPDSERMTYQIKIEPEVRITPGQAPNEDWQIARLWPNDEGVTKLRKAHFSFQLWSAMFRKYDNIRHPMVLNFLMRMSNAHRKTSSSRVLFLQIMKNTSGGNPAPMRFQPNKERVVNKVRVGDVRKSNRSLYSYYLEDGSFWKLDVNENVIVPFFSNSITFPTDIDKGLSSLESGDKHGIIHNSIPISPHPNQYFIRDSTTPYNPAMKIWNNSYEHSDRLPTLRLLSEHRREVHRSISQVYAVSFDKKDNTVSFLSGYEVIIESATGVNPPTLMVGIAPIKEFSKELYNCVQAWNIESDRKFKGKSLQIKLV